MAPPVVVSPQATERRHLGFGAFLARTLTVAVVAPISLLVVPLLLVAFIGAVIAAAAGGSAGVEPLDGARSIGGDDGAADWVLVIPIEGPILADGGGLGPFGSTVAGGEQIKEQLIDAAADDRVRAVVLELNTPGGSITGSMAITDGVAAVQDAGKPVIAYVSEISASGGMWAMAPADTIVASPGSLIGSIGVIFGPLRTYTDVVAIDDGILGGGVETTGGVEQFYVTAGTGKDLGNSFRPLTDEERASLQAATDDFYAMFVAHVAESRGITEDTIRNELGAFIYQAGRAVELGLADQLGNRQDAWAEAATTAGLGEDYDVREVVGDDSFASLFGLRLPGTSADTPAADLSGLCSPTARAFVFHGDLATFCAAG